MDLYDTFFTVHADYIDLGTKPSFILTLIAGLASVIGIGLLIVAFFSIRNNYRNPIGAIMLIAGILLVVVGQYLNPFKSIEGDRAPSIDEVIAAPEGCTIASDRIVKTEDPDVAGINLPDGQKRATYEVEASCQDSDALDGLNALNNTIIFLDQQPLAVAS